MKSIWNWKAWLMALALSANVACGGFPTASKASAPAKKNPNEQQLLMARALTHKGEDDKARQVYEMILKKSPKEAEAHHRLGVIAANAGKFEAARKHFQQAVSLSPRDSKVLSDIGYALFLENKLTEAEHYLKRAIEADDRNVSAYNNLGLVLGHQKRFPEAFEAFRQSGTEAEATANLGYLHAQHGNYDSAEALFSRALSLNSSLRPAAEGLIQIAAQKRRVQNMPIAAKQPVENQLAQHQQPVTEESPAAKKDPAVSGLAEHGLAQPEEVVVSFSPQTAARDDVSGAIKTTTEHVAEPIPVDVPDIRLWRNNILRVSNTAEEPVPAPVAELASRAATPSPTPQKETPRIMRIVEAASPDTSVRSSQPAAMTTPPRQEQPATAPVRQEQSESVATAPSPVPRQPSTAESTSLDSHPKSTTPPQAVNPLRSGSKVPHAPMRNANGELAAQSSATATTAAGDAKTPAAAETSSSSTDAAGRQPAVTARINRGTEQSAGNVPGRMNSQSTDSMHWTARQAEQQEPAKVDRLRRLGHEFRSARPQTFSSETPSPGEQPQP